MNFQDLFPDYLAGDDEGLRVAWEEVYRISRQKLEESLPTSDWVLRRVQMCQDFIDHRYQIKTIRNLPIVYMIAPVLIFHRVAFIDYLSEFAHEVGMAAPQVHWFRSMMNTILDDAWLVWWEHLAKDPEDLRYILRDMVENCDMITDNFLEFQLYILYFLQTIALRAIAIRNDFETKEVQ